MRAVVLGCFLALLGGSFVAAAPVSFEGHSVLRLFPTAQQKPTLEEDLEAAFPYLDWWKEPAPSSDSADVRVAPEQRAAMLAFLTARGIRHETYIENVGALMRLERQSLAMTGDPIDWFKAYHDYNATYAWARQLVADYPSLAQWVTVGHSYEGREIFAIRVTGGSKTADKPQILYDGGIHAREWVATSTPQYILWSLLSKYGNDTEITKLVDAIEWNIVPIFNADGFAFTWTDNRMWRKSRMPNPGSRCIGTDPCRNSDNHWGGKGSSADPCSDTYRGAKPFDQPEVKAIADYALSLPNLRGYINFHSYSQLWMSPWSYDYVTPPEPEYSQQRKLGKEAVAAIKASSGLTYTEGPGAITIYPASGDITDFIYANHPKATYAICVELRDTGRYGFLLPPEQIIPTGEEILAAAKVMARHILENPK